MTLPSESSQPSEQGIVTCVKKEFAVVKTAYDMNVYIYPSSIALFKNDQQSENLFPDLTKVLKKGDKLDFQARYTTPGGERRSRWVAIRGSVYKNVNGRAQLLQNPTAMPAPTIITGTGTVVIITSINGNSGVEGIAAIDPADGVDHSLKLHFYTTPLTTKDERRLPSTDFIHIFKCGKTRIRFQALFISARPGQVTCYRATQITIIDDCPPPTLTTLLTVTKSPNTPPPFDNLFLEKNKSYILGAPLKQKQDIKNSSRLSPSAKTFTPTPTPQAVTLNTPGAVLPVSHMEDPPGSGSIIVSLENGKTEMSTNAISSTVAAAIANRRPMIQPTPSSSANQHSPEGNILSPISDERTQFYACGSVKTVGSKNDRDYAVVLVDLDNIPRAFTGKPRAMIVQGMIRPTNLILKTALTESQRVRMLLQWAPDGTLEEKKKLKCLQISTNMENNGNQPIPKVSNDKPEQRKQVTKSGPIGSNEHMLDELAKTTDLCDRLHQRDPTVDRSGVLSTMLDLTRPQPSLMSVVNKQSDAQMCTVFVPTVSTASITERQSNKERVTAMLETMNKMRDRVRRLAETSEILRKSGNDE